MNAFTSNASLVLHAEDPDWYPQHPDDAVDKLKHIGLAGEKLPGLDNAYLAGDRFLELVAFMGCSPNISFTPDDGSDSFSFVRVTTTPDRVTALTGTHSHPPLCPHCRKPLRDWREKITDTTLQCTSCNTVSPPWQYNWRKSAGFARCFIEITDIYPKEAIPQPALLSALGELNSGSWKYFYHYP